MKLFLLSANYPPTRCGMADYAEKLYYYLKEITKVKPYIITTKLDEPGVKNDPHIYRIMVNWDANENQNFLELMKKEIPDVIHIQYHEEDFPEINKVSELPFMIKQYFSKVKIVISLAGFDLDTSSGVLNVERLVTYSDAITVTTDLDLNLVLNKFPDVKNKLFKVYDRPNIIYDPKLRINRKKFREKFNVSSDDFLLINFGFINQNKGFEHTFHSLRLVIDNGFSVKLLIIGELHDGKHSSLGKYFADLKNLSRELNLENNVIWAGYVNDTVVSSYILCADASVMPFRDGISGKRSSFWSVLEHGIPAITTFPPDKCLPDGLKNGKNAILVSIDDVETLAKGIIKLVKDNKFRCELGKNGQKLVRKRYSWEMLVKELEEIYRFGVAANPRP
ncbi:MAG: glycosyltransferase family 4 protein [Candidatus Firestonebacteria bacterium]|nr:glycosyltransferase family 4 protein [Candidatus Firestonebacteria bacterium]